MTLPTETGAKLISEMTDEELVEMRDYYNSLLEPAFFVNSGKYDNIATTVKEIEQEMTKRELDGPPWIVD